MKGIIRLIPVEHAEKGEKVLYPLVGNDKEFEIFEFVKLVDSGGMGMVARIEPYSSYVHPDELKQLIVEYDGSTALSGSNYMETLPLHPEDWEEGLKLIGKEVDFYGQEYGFKKTPVAKLFPKDLPTPIHMSPILYTEEEVKLLTAVAMGQGATNAGYGMYSKGAVKWSDWWNNNKKK